MGGSKTECGSGGHVMAIFRDIKKEGEEGQETWG